MFKSLRSFFSSGVKNATRIKQQPLNKISLVILIAVNIFVLINVFSGLDSVTAINRAPEEIYFCKNNWVNYKTNYANNSQIAAKINLLNNLVQNASFGSSSNRVTGKTIPQDSQNCAKYDQLATVLDADTELKSLLKVNSQSLDQIRTLENRSQDLSRQYDSTLLENIAGQAPENSINLSDSSRTKLDLAENTAQITELNQNIDNTKTKILNLNSVQNFFKYIDDDNNYTNLKTDYQNYSWQYGILSFVAQIIFLLPLLLLTWFLNNWALKNNREIVFLLTSNLLFVFFIPVIFKVFEFLQFGALAEYIFSVIVPILSALAFLGSYLLIIIIPLFAYLLMRIFQKIGFNPENQIRKRIQEEKCQNCSFKLNKHEMYCPNCGTCQYNQCQNCRKPKYMQLSFCQHCGTQEVIISKPKP